jgi:hypothetical protein
LGPPYFISNLAILQSELFFLVELRVKISTTIFDANYYGNNKPNNSENAKGKKKQGGIHILFVII